MLISPAYAQGAGGVGGFDIVSLMPLVLIFVVFYFLLIHPQRKKMKEHKAMLGDLRRGDRIVTSGGIMGVITKVENESELMVEIARGVRVRVARSMIANVMAKTGPRPSEATEKEPAPRKRQVTDADYYQVLGLKNNANSQAISAAYRKLAKKYHPSHNKGDDEAAEQFQHVSAAYVILSDPEERKKYDALGHQGYMAQSE